MHTLRHFFSKKVITATMIGIASFGLAGAQTTHKVAAGETLYGLAVNYGVSQEAIIKANPGLESTTLKAGQTIVVPERLEKEAPVAGAVKTMHKVARKETLFGIAKNYGLTLDQLLAANPDIKADGSNLKKGKFLVIPYTQAEVEAWHEAHPTGLKHIKLAVVLPLTSGKTEARRSLEFYRGLLMAVDHFKAQGIDTDITAIDEPAADRSLTPVVGKLRESRANFVIGPLYPDHFSELSRLAAETDMMGWVLPFSSKYIGLKTDAKVRMVNTPDEIKAAVMARLLKKAVVRPKVIFLHGGNTGNELIFSAALRNALVAEGITVDDLHVSTAEELKPRLSADSHNLFFIESHDPARAKTLGEAIGQLAIIAPTTKVSALMTSDLTATGTLPSSTLHTADAFVFTDCFPANAPTVAMEREYARWFKDPIQDVTPRMALLGYDLGLHLLTGLGKYGTRFSTQKMQAEPVQSHIRFEQVPGQAGLVNTAAYLIHYKRGTTGAELIQAK